MHKIIVGLIALGLIMPQILWAGSSLCLSSPSAEAVTGHYSNPEKLASYWLKPIEKLYSAIPKLSPSEAEWLESELSNGRAVDSREYALQQVKLNIGGLVGSLRVLTKKIERSKYVNPVEDWTLFAYTLIENDADLYLAGLVKEKILSLDALPFQWSVFAGKNKEDLKDAIRWSRINLARHVLICVVPQFTN